MNENTKSRLEKIRAKQRPEKPANDPATDHTKPPDGDEELQHKMELISSIDVPEYQGVGRKPVIANPVTYKSIVKSVLEGQYISTAAKMAGVAHTSIFDALEKGEKGEDEFYHQFWKDVQMAEAIAEEELVKTIKTHSKFDWRAAEVLLSRRFGDRWARRDQTTVKHEGTVKHEHKNELAERILNSESMRQSARNLLKGNVIDAEYEEVDK